MHPIVNWWQQLPRHIDPVALSIGGFELRYYSLMYMVAFAVVYALVSIRLRREDFSYSRDTVTGYLVWAIIGVMAGGRLGYVLFYDPGFFLAHPLRIVLPFDFSHGFRYTGLSGMSYHGGLLGVAAMTALYCKVHALRFTRFISLFCPAIPLGYMFGRIGNFINGELYGRVTTLAWGMYFPAAPGTRLRHPSQLYEAFFEGLVLFVVLWRVRRHPLMARKGCAFYLIGYGLVRFAIEFVRAPDAHLGFILGPFTMGHILCAAMIAAGSLWLILGRRPV